MAGLSPKRQRFVDEYLIDSNGTQAAIRAGYSRRTANEQAADLLAIPSIREAVTAGQARLAEKTGITQERVLRELARMAFSDTRKLYDENGHLKSIGSLDDDTAATLSGVETTTETSGRGEDAEITVVRKVKRWDKVKALELIGKQLGMFADNVNVNGNLTAVFRDPTQRPQGYARKPVTRD